ncbi:hypothetical protein H8356DRAFT_1418969 [Neocallimastix lanati (nom. inval.)]|nr:hypothetical protein H8356DRAFT_1418969 [Neocallimastix sp. JGI-2020a]
MPKVLNLHVIIYTKAMVLHVHLSSSCSSFTANELESSYEEASAHDMKLSDDKYLSHKKIKPFSDCSNVDAYLDQFTQYHKLLLIHLNHHKANVVESVNTLIIKCNKTNKTDQNDQNDQDYKIEESCIAKLKKAMNIRQLSHANTDILSIPSNAIRSQKYDIIIFSPDLDSHYKHLAEVHDRLRKASLYTKLEKSKFCDPFLDCLSHTISVPAILEWSAPSNIKQLQSFFRPTHPLNILLRKNTIIRKCCDYLNISMTFRRGN